MRTIESLFSNVFNVPVDKVGDKTSLANYDSFKLILFFSLVEKEYATRLLLKGMTDVNTLGELKALLRGGK